MVLVAGEDGRVGKGLEWRWGEGIRGAGEVERVWLEMRLGDRVLGGQASKCGWSASGVVMVVQGMGDKSEATVFHLVVSIGVYNAFDLPVSLLQ